MKKILLTFSLLAMLIAAACDTSKSSVATVATPQQPATPAKPQKGDMKDSDMKPLQVIQYEKKALPKKGQLLPMAATPIPDTVK